MEPERDITKLLQRWHQGDSQAYNALMSLSYGEMKRLAKGLMGKRFGQTVISPTALAHEAYLKLADFQTSRSWQNRRQFYGLIARAMMCFLVDHVRHQASRKRGGDQVRITFEEQHIGGKTGVDVLALEQVLQRLERLDQRRANIWQCRYLCGLSIAELAQLFQLGHSFLHRELKAANGWLRGQLSLGSSSGNHP